MRSGHLGVLERVVEGEDRHLSALPVESISSLRRRIRDAASG
jgi:hypothetical protein